MKDKAQPLTKVSYAIAGDVGTQLSIFNSIQLY